MEYPEVPGVEFPRSTRLETGWYRTVSVGTTMDVVNMQGYGSRYSGAGPHWHVRNTATGAVLASCHSKAEAMEWIEARAKTRAAPAVPEEDDGDVAMVRYPRWEVHPARVPTPGHETHELVRRYDLAQSLTVGVYPRDLRELRDLLNKMMPD